ncbi:MAG: hypothetical protein M3067_11695 [Chloroflexota bacterium]|nr:hypothetical protein [Chloroflexota bacterium]
MTATHRARTSPRRLGRALLGATLALLIVAPAAFAASPGQALLIASTSAPTPAVTTTATVDASAPWLTDESYYLSLVNCTRTGGWVLSNGTCRGYGTGRYSAYVRPLVRSGAISDKVTRPYAKLITVGALCNHFFDGDPGFRLRRAGFVGYAWGENIGCRDGYGTIRAAILQSHLFFQGEKSTNGGHWRNIKNPRFTYIGIGVWHYGNRTRLVTDFYRP